MIPLVELVGRLVQKQEPDSGWSDRRLLAACTRGDENAWAALVEKYQCLVYGLARALGAPEDVAADLFHAVWVHVYSELTELRRERTIRDRLVEMVERKFRHWAQSPANTGQSLEGTGATDRSAVEKVIRDHMLREAIQRLCPPCRRLVELVFYSDTPLPFQEAAQQLGMRTGPFGLGSGLCLRRLQRALESRPV